MGHSKVTSPIHNPDVSEVLAVISSNYALQIIKTLESEAYQHFSDNIMEELKLSKKQFYTTMAHLSNVGITKRNNRAYHLTTFGVLILNSTRLVEDSIRIYSKLKAIDAIGNAKEISNEEIMKLIYTLVDNERVRQILKLNYSL